MFLKKNLPLWCFLFFLFAGNALAEDVTTYLKSKYLKYDENRDTVFASGEVRVRLDDIYVSADRLYMNVKTNYLSAEGNVVIEAPGYHAGADDIFYDIENDQTTFKNFNAVFEPSRVKGKVFITAKNLVDLGQDLKGENGSVTTCDYEHPHYVTRARWIEFYPDDKVIAYSATFYINGVPCFWLPVVVYNLKDRRAKMPSIGNNPVEGDFVKSAWDYYFNRDQNGLLLVDIMSKKGLGLGLDHDYRINERNSGNLYLYNVNEKDSSYVDWVTKLKHNVALGKSAQLALGYSAAAMYLLPQGSRLNQTEYTLGFSYNLERQLSFNAREFINNDAKQEDNSLAFKHVYKDMATSYSYNFSRLLIAPFWSQQSNHLQHSQNLSPNLSLSLDVPYKHYQPNASSLPDQRMDPSYVLSYRQMEYDITFKENWYLDLDADNVKSDDNTVEFIEAHPEVLIGLKKFKVLTFDLGPRFEYGYYREKRYVPVLARMYDFSTNRYKAGVDIGRVFPLVFGTSLSLGWNLSQLQYATGDERYTYAEAYGLNTDVFSFIRNNLGFRRSLTEGNSPFSFDTKGASTSLLNEKLTFYQKNFEWYFDYGFNYLTQKHQDINTVLRVTPSPKLELNARSGWSIESQKYLDLGMGFNFRPIEKAQLRVNWTSDINNGLLKTADTFLDLEIGNTWQSRWRFIVGHQYEFYKENFELKDLVVIKDLHCWEAKFRYVEIFKEFSISFTLKAFPDEPIGWGSGKGFTFETLNKAVGEATQSFQQPSPSRF